MPIRWSGPALQDLREIRDYVSQDDPNAARRLALRIRKGVEHLADHPRSGRVVPEFEQDNRREVIVSPYRIVYEVQANRVVVLRVLHGRRDLISEF